LVVVGRVRVAAELQWLCGGRLSGWARSEARSGGGDCGNQPRLMSVR
jgi:hypothetical protein